jgi:hypothetical protein
MLVLVTVACETPAERRYRQALEHLVVRHATLAEIESELGKSEIYAKDQPGWSGVETFLDKPNARFTAAIKKYSRFMYYTDAWTVTWIALDEQGKAQEFFMFSQ